MSRGLLANRCLKTRIRPALATKLESEPITIDSRETVATAARPAFVQCPLVSIFHQSQSTSLVEDTGFRSASSLASLRQLKLRRQWPCMRSAPTSGYLQHSVGMHRSTNRSPTRSQTDGRCRGHSCNARKTTAICGSRID